MEKNKLIFLALIVAGITFYSCKKKKDNPSPTTPSCTYLVSQEQVIDSAANDTTINKYFYNSNKKIVKFATYDTKNTLLSYDTITYSNSTEIDSVLSYDFSVSSTTPATKRKYSYTSGMISSIVEAGNNSNGSYNKTIAYSYNGSNQFTGLTETYNSGSAGTGDLTSISGVTFTNGNITSATANMNGVGSQAVSATNDVTASNPYLGVSYDPEDPTTMFDANNPSSVTIGSIGSSTFTYTYSNGRVATITERDVFMASPSKTITTLTYNCY